MKKHVDILIEKTFVNGQEVEDDYWNNLVKEITEFLNSDASEEDKEKLRQKALLERVYMCSDYSDK